MAYHFCVDAECVYITETPLPFDPCSEFPELCNPFSPGVDPCEYYPQLCPPAPEVPPPKPSVPPPTPQPAPVPPKAEPVATAGQFFEPVAGFTALSGAQLEEEVASAAARALAFEEAASAGGPEAWLLAAILLPAVIGPTRSAIQLERLDMATTQPGVIPELNIFKLPGGLSAPIPPYTAPEPQSPLFAPNPVEVPPALPAALVPDIGDLGAVVVSPLHFPEQAPPAGPSTQAPEPQIEPPQIGVTETLPIDIERLPQKDYERALRELEQGITPFQIIANPFYLPSAPAPSRVAPARSPSTSPSTSPAPARSPASQPFPFVSPSANPAPFRFPSPQPRARPHRQPRAKPSRSPPLTALRNPVAPFANLAPSRARSPAPSPFAETQPSPQTQQPVKQKDCPADQGTKCRQGYFREKVGQPIEYISWSARKCPSFSPRHP